MNESMASASSVDNLLAAQNLDALAGQARQQCLVCASENFANEVEVGACFIREQVLTGSSSPNSRVCVFASRRPLFSDLYPPFDISILEALRGAVSFDKRDDVGGHRESFKKFSDSVRLQDADFEKICDELSENQVVVLKAPTGFGKSTWLPYRLCWDPKSQFSDNFGKIIVAQPRKLAAESVAATVSRNHEYRSPGPSIDVGLHHGETSLSGEANKLIFVTDGSLIKRLINRELNDVQLLIVDEAHERNERIELILLILRFLLPQYPHLRLLILSATIEPKFFVEYYASTPTDDSKFVSVSANSIELEDPPRLVYEPRWGQPRESGEAGAQWKENKKYKPEVFKLCDLIEEVCSTAIRDPVLNEANRPPGHVLVFLPGKSDIEWLEKLLSRRAAQRKKSKEILDQFKVVPLHGELSAIERAKVMNFSTSSGRSRQLVLATNIAESSITVDNLVCVVDGGLSKSKRENGRLSVRWITKAEQKQRQGRVNRNRPGYYFAFFSKQNFESMSGYPDSQILTISQHQMELFVLRAMLAGLPPAALRSDSSFLLSPPGLGEKMGAILEHLKVAGAISGESGSEHLTPIGVTAAASGTALDIAELLVLADLNNVLPEVACVAAAICANRENDFFKINKSPSVSPHLKAHTRMQIESIVRDTYMLQSFDKTEVPLQNQTMTLLARGDKVQYGDIQSDERVKKLWARRLELCDEVVRTFKERVPEERNREINPSLFHRAQLVVNAWTTRGWRRDVRILLDSRAKELAASTMCAIYEGLVVRCNADSMDDAEEDLKRFDHLNIMQVRRAEHGTCEAIRHETNVALENPQLPTMEPRHVIVETWRRHLLSPLPAMLFDPVDLGVAERSSHDEIESELAEGFRELEAFVPELVAPPGSRWERNETGLFRDLKAERESTEISDNPLESHALLAPVDESSSDLPEDDQVLTNSDQMERLVPSSCLWLDAVNRQFGTTHAPIAGRFRRHAASETWRLSESSPLVDGTEASQSEFQVRRHRETRKLHLVADYLESALAMQIKPEEPLPFRVLDMKKGKGEVYFRPDEAGGEILYVCKVEVQRGPEKTSTLTVGAWQIFHEFPALAARLDINLVTLLEGLVVPPRLLSYGSHRLSSWTVGGRQFVVFDGLAVPFARLNLDAALQPHAEESPAEHYARVRPNIERFAELHQELRLVQESLRVQ